MKIIKEKAQFREFLRRSDGFDDGLFDVVRSIVDSVISYGDKVVLELTNEFDGASFASAADLKVSDKEFQLAEKNLSEEIKSAIKNAYKRIESYHKKQLPTDLRYKDEVGAELGNLWRSIERVGVYVPGGTASYPSSVLMSAVPAVVAGVKDIVICSPSNKGKIDDAVLYAAQICGIKDVFKVGGAQAIAAMALGTDTINKVDKIVGPGNSYVAMAKKMLYGTVGIDMIAGPTDLTIICDESVDSKFIACDALSQLEHGADSKVFVITNSEDFAVEIFADIEFYAKKLSRKDIVAKSLENSAVILVDDLSEAPQVANEIAPEHLQIMCEGGENMVAKIQNAGAIFLGKYSPEPIGDYIAGPSHTLPTSGNARFASGLSVYDFLKRISLIGCDKNSFELLADDAEVLAQSEGFTAHKLSIAIRRGKN